MSRANTFRNFESRSPYVEKRSAARATRYGDIPLCMGKQSKTCESFELDEILTQETSKVFLVTFWETAANSVIQEPIYRIPYTLDP